LNKNDVAEYLRATRSVEGWFFPIDAYLFAAIDEIQGREGITGNLFEIGVHHGKTAIFLARMLRAGEVLGVCDVFEQQDLNRDHSGEGSRELFEKNMRALGGPARVFAKSSHELTVADTTANCRFFHIDGGHRPEDVLADLKTAARALHAAGIVALDDLFDPSWPGVSEGFYRSLAARPDTFTPILIGGNKVLLARDPSRYALEDIASLVDTRAFRFEQKEWLGRSVTTASRLAWVDLDPAGTARLHAPVWPDVIPRIVAKHTEPLVRFIQRVFAASGDFETERPTTLHIGDSPIMISEAGAREIMTAFLYVYVPDTDATFARALREGVTVLEEPLETPYGDRRCMIRDRWGNTWQIATPRRSDDSESSG